MENPWPKDWPDEWDGDDGKLWSREETARVLSWSLPKFDRSRHAGLPCRREGKNGRSYGYYFPEVFAWVSGAEAKEEAERKQREADQAQAEMALLGGNAKDDRAGLTADQRKRLYETELVEMKVRRERGELVDARELLARDEKLLGDLGKFLQSLPEAIGRELELDLGVIGALQEKIDKYQEELARRLMKNDGPAPS